MARARVVLGKTGEDLACGELARRGYAILERRYRRRGGELDVIARDGGTMVFVEVKTREGTAFGDGADAITALKRHRMTQMAREYLARHRLIDVPCRFDVVVVRMAAGRASIEVYVNAFDAC